MRVVGRCGGCGLRPARPGWPLLARELAIHPGPGFTSANPSITLASVRRRQVPCWSAFIFVYVLFTSISFPSLFLHLFLLDTHGRTFHYGHDYNHQFAQGFYLLLLSVLHNLSLALDHSITLGSVGNCGLAGRGSEC